MEQREVSKNEHTLNIRAGLAVLKTKYGMSIDEYDFLDIAVDVLSSIQYFGVTEYVSYVTVDNEGKASLPCIMDTIDAVTTEHMARKAFSTRVEHEVDGILNTDIYYTMQGIMNHLGRDFIPGIGGFRGEGYISYTLSGKYIKVDKVYAGTKIAVAFTGITTDLEGYPLITRKQSNALASATARVLSVKGANKGDKGLASMVEYYTGESGRLIQAAAIPENITDNEINEVLNAKTSFNRKSINRPSKYSR